MQAQRSVNGREAGKVGCPKPLAALLIILNLLLLGWVCFLQWHRQMDRLDARAAWNVLMEYENCRRVAISNNPSGAVELLRYVAQPRQKGGSRHLNLIVDYERERTVQDIIQHLRQQTGEDLGNDPKRWVDRYGLKRANESKGDGKDKTDTHRLTGGEYK